MEDREKNRIAVTIMGEEYILRGTSSPEDMHRVGRYVDQMMKKLSVKNIQMSRHKIAVLAALNLADELLRYKEEESQPSGKTKERGVDDGLV